VPNVKYCRIQDALLTAKNNLTFKYIVIKGNTSAYSINLTVDIPITIIGPYSDSPPSVSSSVVPATFIGATNMMPVLTVSATGGPVTIDGLRIQNGTGTGAMGLVCSNGPALTLLRSVVTNNDDIGVSITPPCSLTVDQSIIGKTQSTAANHGGGIKLVDVSATIKNSFITGNGSATSPIQGIYVAFTGAAKPFTFINNTVADNVGAAGSFAVGGLFAVATNLVIDNNLFWNNTVAGVAGSGADPVHYTVRYACTDDSTVWSNGNNNVALTGGPVSPKFVAPGDYHITASSPCAGKGTSNNAPAYDIDGDPRAPDFDIGADQH
jgi:hypothetical protein